MKKQKLFYVFLLLFTGVLVLNSCKDNNNDDDDVLPDASFAAEISRAEAMSNEIGTLVDYAFNDGKLKSINDGFPFGNCATITFDLESEPKKMTVDFGDVNCLCADNRYRRGKVIVEYTGNYQEEGSLREITTQDFYINDNQVVLERTVTNQGYNNSNHLEFTITEQGTINWSDGTSYEWNSDRKREWIEGESTIEIIDDVYLITGTANGSNSSGDSFVKVISSPLEYKINCTNIVSGIVSITMNNSLNVIINFGDGVCDNTAIVTILGVTFVITLW